MLEIAIANALIATLLAGMVLTIGQICKKPALLHALWIVVLVKLIIWPVIDLPIPRGVQSSVQRAAVHWNISPRPFESPNSPGLAGAKTKPPLASKTTNEPHQIVRTDTRDERESVGVVTAST